MSDAVEPSERPSPRAQGRVLRAVNQTWPGFISGAADGRARELIEEDRYGEAIEVLEKGVERYGAASVSPLMMAWCLHSDGRQEEALTWAERAVEADPENADVHWVRSNILFMLDRTEEAVEPLWRAVELTPDNGHYYTQLAWYLYRDQEFAKTRKLVEQALERAPDDPYVHHIAGRIFDHHLRSRRAQRHYERALELQPGEAEIQIDLAALLQSRGRLSGGVRLAGEAVANASETIAPFAAEMYEWTLRRWSWRWYEWALRAVLVLNAIDWIFPTSFPVGAVLSGAFVAVYAAGWVRSLLVLPAECRRDLVANERLGFFAGAVLRTLLLLGGIALMLLGELNALQHLGMLALIVGAYVEWYWWAARISGPRMSGPGPE